MAEKPIKVVHYVNQFFGGLGGEEQADVPPTLHEGPKGPGLLLQQLSPDVQVVATIVAGDNYMASDIERSAGEVLALLETVKDPTPDLLIAGPAFNAGRYGIACAAVCTAAQERLSLPCLTALHDGNPAVESYRQRVTMVRTSADVLGMRDALAGIARVAAKLLADEPLIPAVDGTLPRGLRNNTFVETPGAKRAVAMLLAKMRGEPFVTEYPMPVFDRVTPAPAIADLSRATIALVTSGGIVPRGNPDHIESADASCIGAHPLAGLSRLNAESHQSVHGGYDPSFANADPNRVLPLDVIRQLATEQRIGKLHETYYATVGNATSVARAKRFGEEIAATLINEGVQAVILTST
jgi:glycine reductase